MKKACSVCRSNCLRLHGPAEEEDEEDAAACRLCALRRFKGNEHVEGHRNPSFLKKLTESTMTTLKLPLSFVSDQKERLGDSVFLEGPSREKWRVNLHGSLQSLNLSFGQGWEKFVADHFLQRDDQLTFSLSEQSIFQVEVYDGSGCQKRSALDATNTPSNVQIEDLRSHDVNPVLRQKKHSKCVDATQPLEQHCTDLTTSGSGLRVRRGNYAEAAVNDVKVTEKDMEVAEYGVEVVGNGMMVAENEMEAVVNEEEMQENSKEDAEAARPEHLVDSELGGGLMKVTEVIDGGLLPEQKVVRGKVLSKRRSVTESEVVRALQAAQALKLPNPNTVMVMRSSQVYTSFWLVLPKQFREQWMPSKPQKITLVNKGGHSWTANWTHPQGGLSGGWRRFSIDHRLEDRDVCVFELIDKTSCVLLVHIFRVLGCGGEDSGLYTPTGTPSKSTEENKKKRKSVSNGREARGTPGKVLDRKNIQARLSLDFQDVPIDKLSSEPVSAKKSLERISGLLVDDKASAPPAKTTGLSSLIHQEKLMGIGKTHSMEKLVDQACLQERVGNESGGQDANADDLGEKDRVASRACGIESNPSSSQQALVVFRPGSENMLVQNRLFIPNGSGSSLCPANSADLHKQVSNRVEISSPTEQCAPTANSSTRKVSVAKQEFKVVYIYRGRSISCGTEYLTELEGYSDERCVTTLARDDDTGFWWVPSDLFGWDMQHCYID